MVRTEWAFETNEAFDMILLLNAISNDPFYNQHYLDVREKWATKIGESGYSLISHVRNIISMSKLCSELSQIEIMTLNDVISFFEDATKLNQSSLQILLPHREIPIAFQLPNGGMVMHPSPRGYMHHPKQLASLCLHESLHCFPDSLLSQERQDELLKTNNEIEKHFRQLITKYNSGPEEYFVVGAEAYLSLKLNLRTHEECIEYLKTQNNGMLLSLAIYEDLRNINPDQENGWLGYGRWLHKQLPRYKLFLIELYTYV